MSVRASGWAWSLRNIEPLPKFTLMALADQADENGYCWPSQALIADGSPSYRDAARPGTFVRHPSVVDEGPALERLPTAHRCRGRGIVGISANGQSGR